MKLIKVILVFLCVVLLVSCNKKTFESTNPKVQKAREGLAKIKSLTPNDKGFIMMERILNQPDFTGPIKDFGCMAVIDGNGNLRAYTIKVIDFETGRKFATREYTKQELDESRNQILKYKEKTGLEGFIPILSESMRLACAQAALSEDMSKTYMFKRSGVLLQAIERSSTGDMKVVAADALYGEPK